jgi:hypothetical protein
MKRNSQVKLLTFLLLLLRLLGFTDAVDNVWMNGREWIVCTGTIFVVFFFFFEQWPNHIRANTTRAQLRGDFDISFSMNRT